MDLCASIWPDERTGLYKYRCWHHVRYGSAEWLRLCDVRAAIATGEVRWLGEPQAAVWYRRLWWEAGLILPAPVALPALPPHAAADLVATAEGFRLLVGLRRLTHAGPTPFTDRFVGSWCGLPRRRAPRARNRLIELGVIKRAGTASSGFPIPTPLYEPGAIP